MGGKALEPSEIVRCEKARRVSSGHWQNHQMDVELAETVARDEDDKQGLSPGPSSYSFSSSQYLSSWLMFLQAPRYSVLSFPNLFSVPSTGTR